MPDKTYTLTEKQLYDIDTIVEGSYPEKNLAQLLDLPRQNIEWVDAINRYTRRIFLDTVADKYYDRQEIKQTLVPLLQRALTAVTHYRPQYTGECMQRDHCATSIEQRAYVIEEFARTGRFVRPEDDPILQQIESCFSTA